MAGVVELCWEAFVYLYPRGLHRQTWTARRANTAMRVSTRGYRPPARVGGPQSLDERRDRPDTASGALGCSPARYIVCSMTMLERYGVSPVRDDPRGDDPSPAHIIPESQAGSTAT